MPVPRDSSRCQCKRTRSPRKISTIWPTQYRGLSGLCGVPRSMAGSCCELRRYTNDPSWPAGGASLVLDGLAGQSAVACGCFTVASCGWCVAWGARRGVAACASLAAPAGPCSAGKFPSPRWRGSALFQLRSCWPSSVASSSSPASSTGASGRPTHASPELGGGSTGELGGAPNATGYAGWKCPWYVGEPTGDTGHDMVGWKGAGARLGGACTTGCTLPSGIKTICSGPNGPCTVNRRGACAVGPAFGGGGGMDAGIWPRSPA